MKTAINYILSFIMFILSCPHHSLGAEDPKIMRITEAVLGRLHTLQKENDVRISHGQDPNYVVNIYADDLIGSDEEHFYQKARVETDRAYLNELWDNQSYKKEIAPLIRGLKTKSGEAINYYIVNIGIYEYFVPSSKEEISWETVQKKEKKNYNDAINMQSSDWFKRLVNHLYLTIQKDPVFSVGKNNIVHFAMSSFIAQGESKDRNSSFTIVNSTFCFDNTKDGVLLTALKDVGYRANKDGHYETGTVDGVGTKEYIPSRELVAHVNKNVQALSSSLEHEETELRQQDYFSKITLPSGVSGLKITKIDSVPEEVYDKLVERVSMLSRRKSTNYGYDKSMASESYNHVYIDGISDLTSETKENLTLLDHKLRFLAEYSRKQGYAVDIYAVFQEVPLVVNGDWNSIAKKVYQKAGLKDAILITIPYLKHSQPGVGTAQIHLSYFMPGLYFTPSGDKLNVKISDIGKVPALRLGAVTGGYGEYESVGMLQSIDFIRRVYTQTYKPMEIQVAYHYFGGDIKREFISSESYKPSNSFTRKAILMQYPQAEELARTRKEIEKRYSELRSGMSGPNTLGQYYSARDKLASLLSSIDHDKRNFKNVEPSIALKEKYTEGDYFLAYAAQQFTDGDDITLRNLLIGIGYPQEGLARNMVYDFNAKVWDSKVYNAADALSIVLAPVGLDIIGDGIGLVYSGLRGNFVDASMYGAGVLIAVVPGGALRIMRRGAASAEDVIAHAGRFYRQAGDQLIEMSFEKADLITTFKFKNPDALSDDLVSSFFEALKENKVSDDLMALIRNTADDNEKLRLLANNVGNTGGQLLSKGLQERAVKIIKLARETSSTKFATDEKTILKVADFLNDKNAIALKAIGGEDGLTAIINANVRAGCATCGTAKTTFLKNMDEYLDDVLDFASKYSDKEGFNEVLQELKMININNPGTVNYRVEGATFMLDKIRRTDNITPSSVKRFDGRFEGEIDHICERCRFDIELTDGTKFEYKSYSKESIDRISTSEVFLKQHLSYLAEATEINKINYEFDARKFSDRSKIVEQFKKMYVNNAKKVFEANPDLFNKIKDFDGDLIEKWQDFKNYISDERFSSSNRLVNFIKVE